MFGVQVVSARGQSAMKQSAMKPISAAKKMLLLGGYFAIRDKEGQRRYMEKLSKLVVLIHMSLNGKMMWTYGLVQHTYILNVFVSQSKSIHWGRPDEL